MLLYYITDRNWFPGPEEARRRALLDRIAAASSAGVDLIQLREKDFDPREMLELSRAALNCLHAPTKLLINSRADVALAAGAHGLHLPADDISPADARALFHAGGNPHPFIAVSCHDSREVSLAAAHGADIAVFAPVFEKVAPKSKSGGQGLRALHDAAQAAKRTTHGAIPMALLALGGVDETNAAACLHAGADGIAGIRLFQQPALTGLPALVARLRAQPGANAVVNAATARHPYLPK